MRRLDSWAALGLGVGRERRRAVSGMQQFPQDDKRLPERRPGCGMIIKDPSLHAHLPGRRPMARRVALLVISLLLALIARAEPCLDFSDHPRLVASFEDWATRGVAVDGQYAYCAEWHRIAVIRYGGVEEPHIARYVQVPGDPFEVALSGQYLLVAAAELDLLIMDVSDPTDPVVVGSYDSEREVYALDVKGNLAYLLSRWDLKVVDVSDPAAPAVLGVMDVPEYGYRIDVEGGFAYLGTWGGDNLHVVDVSDPAAMTVVASLPTGSTPHDVSVVGDRAYVAERTTGLLVVDVSDPHQPAAMGRVAMTEDACMRVLAPGGDLVFAGDGYGGTKIVDVSDPWRPRIVGNLGSALLWQTQCAYDDGLLFVPVTGHGLQIIDVSSVGFQPQVGARIYEGVSVRDMVLHGDHLICAGYPGAFAVGIEPGLAAEPRTLLDINQSSMALVVADDLLYVAGWYGGFHIVDIGDLDQPAVLGSIDPWYSAGMTDLAVRDGHVFLTTWMPREFIIVDARNPSAPVVRAVAEAPYACESVEVVGDHAYLATYEGLYVYDISNLDAPALVTVVDDGHQFGEMALVGPFLYVTDLEAQSLRIYELAVPQAPEQVGEIATPFNDRPRFELVGDWLFMSASRAGVQVMDVSDPVVPWTVGYVDNGLSPERSYAVAVSRGQVFQASDHGEFTVSPALCRLEYDAHPWWAADGVAVDRGESPLALDLAPNPANPGSRVSFDVARGGPVEVVLHDLAGRRVATLLQTSLPSGRHAITWDGRTERGATAASGTYLVRVRTPAGTATRKLAVIR